MAKSPQEQAPAEKTSPESGTETTSTGLEPKVAGLLCYVLGWISGLVFLLLEPRNKFIRFHAKQSIIVFGAINAIVIALSILGWIPFLGVIFHIINYIIGAIAFVLWVVLMVKAYQGTMYKLPWVGDRVEKWEI